MPKKNVLKTSSEVFVPQGLGNLIDDNLIGSVGGKGDAVKIHGKAHIYRNTYQGCISQLKISFIWIPLHVNWLKKTQESYVLFALCFKTMLHFSHTYFSFEAILIIKVEI